MYTISNKLKTFSIALIILGLLGVGYGFMTSHKSFEEVETMLAEETAHHGGDHAVATEAHVLADDSDNSRKANTHDATADVEHHVDDHAKHVEHVQHQIANRPWSAVYVAAFFFFMIALGVLAFYAIQHASQAGWSPVLFRVMEGITGYLLPGSIIMFILLLLSVFGINHIFHWMDAALFDPENEKYDFIVANKAAWLNTPGFLIRAAIYLIGWNLYRHYSRKYTLKQDEEGGTHWFKKNFKISAIFLVFFVVTESMMSWDWIMGFDPHWFSTLFGWYVFVGMFVSGIAVIAMVTIYLKSLCYLEYVNKSHIHDLAKFMFAISIFWTYLWFSQFMLIWYANIPEEVTYFVTRIQDFNLLFFGMLVLNFVFPLLLLMNADFKRVNWLVICVGIIILTGHYIDVYVMVMPATVGKSASIGLPEISAVLFFLGLFILVVFNTLTKAPLLTKGNPFIEESKHFHY